MARKATFEDLEQRIRVLEEECAKGKQAAEGLVKERDFTSAILDTAGALVVVLDREGRITRFNRACEQVTGYSAAAVSGRVFWEFLVPPEEFQGVMQTWKALQAGNFPNQHENRWVAKNGSRRIISWSNTAVVDPRGEVEHIIATGIDITERKRVEDALQKERHALRERVRELGCLYRFFELIAKPGISFEGILQDTTDLLPSGWQYPDTTHARIVLDGHEHTSKGFKEGRWRQTEDIVVHGRKAGVVEVFHVKEKPACEEGLFPKEERELIHAIADGWEESLSASGRKS